MWGFHQIPTRVVVLAAISTAFYLGALLITL